MSINSFEEVKMLYKYRYFDDNHYHIQTILENKFYFATRKQLNDPFDLSLSPDYVNSSNDEIINHYKSFADDIEYFDKIDKDEKIQNIIDEIERSPENFKRKLDNGLNNELNKFRVCSFSGNKWNSTLMWAHYSKSNTGFCVGINFEKLSRYIMNNSQISIIPFIVEYGNLYPIINPYIKTKSIESFKKFFTYKYQDWSYENELRLVVKNNDMNKSGIFTIPADFIEEVYLGLYISEVNKSLIINGLKLNGSKAKIYQIVQPKDKFQFDREEIEIYK